MRALSKAAGLVVIGASHLAVIPVMAMYGVSVCPVLSERGFSFGCRFTSALIAGVLALDVVLNLTSWLWFEAFCHGRKSWIRKARFVPLTALAIHIGAFVVCTQMLTRYLKTIDVPLPTIDRMQVALGYTAALLGVLQATVLDWFTHSWIRNRLLAMRDAGETGRAVGRLGLVARWAYARVWELMPIGVCFSVAAVAVHRKIFDFVDEDIDVASALMAWRELAKVGAMLAAWLVLIRIFSALKEREIVSDVHRHLEAMSQLDGDYRSPTVATGFWENVFAGLNRTTEIIAQRARLIRGLSSYVSGNVTEKVLAGRQLKPEGERRDLVLLVSDLRDFTSISNELSADKVVQLLNLYFSDMIEVLTAHGATLDKFIGDGILAYFEETPSGARAEERAVRAAFAMHDRLVSTNEKLLAVGLPSVALGAAIHSGDVVLGSIGSPEKMQFTVIGDPVNVASRLEPMCKRLAVGVVVSERVVSKLPTGLRDRFVAPVSETVRGVREKLVVYTALPSVYKGRVAA